MALLLARACLASHRGDPRDASQLAMDAGDAFDLTLRREPLVKTLAAEHPDLGRPRGELAFPSLDASLLGLGVGVGEVRTDSQHPFQRHRARDHVARAPPGIAPDLLGSFEEVANDLVEARRERPGRPLLLQRLPIGGDPAMNLVEELGLEDPLLLLAAAAQSIDPVAERTIPF